MFDDLSGVVFDLDGTVVRLQVPWEEVEIDIRDRMREYGVKTDGKSVWTLLEDARNRDLLDIIEPLLCGFEVEGATRSKRLPLADIIPTIRCPVAICSLNCERACHRALEVHALTEAVDVVIGRDTVHPWKPDPAPLEEAISQLGTTPDDGLFIGDSTSDAQTAHAAGVPYASVQDALTRLELS